MPAAHLDPCLHVFFGSVLKKESSIVFANKHIASCSSGPIFACLLWFRLEKRKVPLSLPTSTRRQGRGLGCFADNHCQHLCKRTGKDRDLAPDTGHNQLQIWTSLCTACTVPEKEHFSAAALHILCGSVEKRVNARGCLKPC